MDATGDRGKATAPEREEVELSLVAGPDGLVCWLAAGAVLVGLAVVAARAAQPVAARVAATRVMRRARRTV